MIWDGVALNSTPSIGLYKETEVALCTAGIGLDWGGWGYDKLTEAQVAAIVDVQTYDALRTAAANDLLRDLQEAIAEVDAGRVVDHADVMREIRSLFEGRVSPAELEAFDRA